jgi:arginase family enzyme
MDERMHTTPWFHATDIPNAPPSNLVQIGIGGWIGNRPGIRVAQERDTTVITISDIEELGMERAMEIALECAWNDVDAVFVSFDIDCIDPGFAPGTGTPEPGGLLPREALKALRMVAREGICGLEVVEIAPEYDHSDITAQLGARVIMDVLGTLVEEGHLGTRSTRREREQRGVKEGLLEHKSEQV